MLWMLQNVQGSPVILEAQIAGISLGQSLQHLHRSADRAGLELASDASSARSCPSVEVDRRVSEVQEIYNTTDLARAQQLLDLYGVRYIIVGSWSARTTRLRGWRSSTMVRDRAICKPAYTRAAR